MIDIMTHTEAQLIRSNTNYLENRIAEYRKKVQEWQSRCKHDLVEGEYKANTGNWCAQDDSYWITAKCLDCGKQIHADSGTELYRKLSNSGMISSEYDTKDKFQRQCNTRLELEKHRLLIDKSL
jgi:hypothetical protein